MTFDLDLLHRCRPLPWPWLWYRWRSLVKVKGQILKSCLDITVYILFHGFEVKFKFYNQGHSQGQGQISGLFVFGNVGGVPSFKGECHHPARNFDKKITISVWGNK